MAVRCAGPTCWCILLAAWECACEGNTGQGGRLAARWHGAVRCLGTACIPAQVSLA